MNFSMFVKNIFVHQPKSKLSKSLRPVVITGEDTEHHYLELKLKKEQAKELFKELKKLGVYKW